MDRIETETVSKYFFESAMTRAEWANRRWFIAWLVTFIVLVSVVAGVVWYESQWVVEETTVTQDVDTGDGDAIITGIGDVHYGESTTDYDYEETDAQNGR